MGPKKLMEEDQEALEMKVTLNSKTIAINNLRHQKTVVSLKPSLQLQVQTKE